MGGRGRETGVGVAGLTKRWMGCGEIIMGAC